MSSGTNRSTAGRAASPTRWVRALLLLGIGLGEPAWGSATGSPARVHADATRGIQRAADSTWRDHDRAADSAAAHGAWDDYLYHVRVLDSLLHHHPGVTTALARGHAQRSDTAAAFAALRELAAAGVSRDLTKDTLLRPLHASASWTSLLDAFAANAQPRGRTTTVFTSADTGFAAEDIAYDARRARFLLSGIRRRSVIAVDGAGHERTLLASSPDAPLWAVLALGVDSARDRLWVTTVGNDRIPGRTAGERPRASILSVRLDDGRLLRRYDLPDDGVPREPADLVVAPDGDVYVSDGRTGAMYAIRNGVDSVAVLVPAGTFVGPQQPVLGREGRTLLVPDYVRGLAAVDRVTGALRWFTNPRRVVLNGIDGLVRAGPDALIGVQNGVAPSRIVRLTIDEERAVVTRSEVLAQGGSIEDPTHGIMMGNDYVVIAYSGGEAVRPDGGVRSGARLRPPVVARLSSSPP